MSRSRKDPAEINEEASGAGVQSAATTMAAEEVSAAAGQQPTGDAAPHA